MIWYTLIVIRLCAKWQNNLSVFCTNRKCKKKLIELWLRGVFKLNKLFEFNKLGGTISKMVLRPCSKIRNQQQTRNDIEDMHSKYSLLNKWLKMNARHTLASLELDLHLRRRFFIFVTLRLWCWSRSGSCCFWQCFVNWSYLLYTNCWVGSAFCWRDFFFLQPAFEQTTQKLKQSSPQSLAPWCKRIPHLCCFLQTIRAQLTFSHVLTD